jgi:hypothetical protein
MNDQLVNTAATASPHSLKPRASWRKKALITVGVLAGVGAVTVASAAFWYNYNFNASAFRAVSLTQPEAKVLDQKVEVLKGNTTPQAPATDPAKTLVLSEREINGFLKEQGIGEHFKVRIKNDNITLTAVLPVDKDAPVMAGKNIRVSAVLATKLGADHHLAMSLSDLTVGGISLPNAWLGNIKGLDLLAENMDDEVLNGFAAGIKDFSVQDGEVRLVLND